MGKVGVVIPVYNRIASTMRAIDSIREQTAAVDEVIVVDDGSTIDLSSVRSHLKCAGGRWIRLAENAGVAAARNAGVAESDSSWICFLDSDDEWLPQKIERQMEWHRENVSIRISQVQEEWIRNDKPVKKPPHWRQEGGGFSQTPWSAAPFPLRV
ncbi:MAG: glycosyltransferase family 2 protein [Verrucomicrobiales bacterium]|nr:glycosyltransferase family 2 protein [Verrucomicrobiales bacterium]